MNCIGPTACSQHAARCTDRLRAVRAAQRAGRHPTLVAATVVVVIERLGVYGLPAALCFGIRMLGFASSSTPAHRAPITPNEPQLTGARGRTTELWEACSTRRRSPSTRGYGVAADQLTSILAGLGAVRSCQRDFYRDLHANPQLSYQATRTAANVVARLR
jgi:hypothetical protein